MATKSETIFETVDRIIIESGGFYRPLGGHTMAIDPEDDPRSNGYCVKHGNYNGRELSCPECRIAQAPAPTYRTCPVCDGATLHADRCPASADPTLTATWGTLLKQTADELEACWRSLGQINPNRHVTAARKLLGE